MGIAFPFDDVTRCVVAVSFDNRSDSQYRVSPLVGDDTVSGSDPSKGPNLVHPFSVIMLGCTFFGALVELLTGNVGEVAEFRPPNGCDTAFLPFRPGYRISSRSDLPVTGLLL
jgi:hypothetical protein